MLLLEATSNPATHEQHATMEHQCVPAHARSLTTLAGLCLFLNHPGRFDS